MKYCFFIFLWIPGLVFAQDNGLLTLDQANEMAQQHYPLVKQRDLLNKTSAISISNLNKSYLPQFSLNGQATYQSDVTSLGISFPGVNVKPLSKDQYKVQAEMNQLIYDGGVIKEQKQLLQLNNETEQSRLEVDLYKVKERVNQIYLSILYIDEQIKQVALLKSDLNNGIKKVEVQVNNGVALRSNLNVLKAELLKTDQKEIELRATRKGLVETLGLFTGQTLPEDLVLQKPLVTSMSNDEKIERPELKLFSLQQKMIGTQTKLINAKNLPKTSLFVQSGYGRPGLNFLKNEFALYYIGGVRFSWLLGGFYTSRKEKQQIKINQQMVDVQKEIFLLNTDVQIKQQKSEIDKLQKLIVSDKQIIDLRISIKDAAKAQLENGVITSNDYLREVNAEDLARQTLITHQLQLLQAQINYQTLLGK
jgi:outer membrane protein TolC